MLIKGPGLFIPGIGGSVVVISTSALVIVHANLTLQKDNQVHLNGCI